MDKKKSFGEGLEAFFAGKGFYIVLFLCVSVIGVSAWAMLTGRETDVDNGVLDITLEDNGESVQTGKTDYPVVTEPVSTPAPKPQPSAKVEIPSDPVPTPEPVPENPAPAPEPETPTVSADFFIWPLTGEIENGYSMTALVYNRTMRDWRTHDGVDLAAELGAQVKAAGAGIVSEVYEDDMYGTTVIIDHGGGLVSTYSNLAALPTVAAGDAVVTGQVIGSVGDTALCEIGEVTHLHFAMALDGESIDPTDYLP